MDDQNLILTVIFYRSENNKEPVREWLKNLSQEEKKLIGEAIKTVQFSYPIGMPLVRKIYPDLWEVRINLKNKIARVFFSIQNQSMILLHGFIKKSQKTPNKELKIAQIRLKNLQE
ncbi:type II toxin-antitoxin system RelE/ParE family toxin [Geminocystis herdmanii]|uniref:type II toxin-antitoxin system RelE/ParE family toxin n=1 Tax=Geminocystis herdmanii TaxID=669359 RepID=UPI00034A4764|nr:type II toxin-antitoxin system RelE/ParE family toxin [Geminocystis herdmanii]